MRVREYIDPYPRASSKAFLLFQNSIFSPQKKYLPGSRIHQNSVWFDVCFCFYLVCWSLLPSFSQPFTIKFSELDLFPATFVIDGSLQFQNSWLNQTDQYNCRSSLGHPNNEEWRSEEQTKSKLIKTQYYSY